MFYGKQYKVEGENKKHLLNELVELRRLKALMNKLRKEEL